MPYIGHNDITIISTSFLVTISIYVPRAGHNQYYRQDHRVHPYFNLCAPCGAQLAVDNHICHLLAISIYVPHAGHNNGIVAVRFNGIFQFMCPVRGTTTPDDLLACLFHISIYVPRAGHNFLRPHSRQTGTYFNLRALCRAQRTQFDSGLYRIIISIYVPRAGHNAFSLPNW